MPEDMRDKSIVVMPAAHRPEFAALALLFLSKAVDCPEIRIYVDHVSDKLIDEFQYVYITHAPLDRTKIFYRDPHRVASSGVWNILHSIKDGYETGAENVFLVEEHVFVRSEFFHRHWETMSTGKYLASCGRICPRFSRLNAGVYTNPGSCLVRPLLDNLVPHINDKFFDDTGGYIRNLMPEKPGYIGGLDDGLIRRVITVMGGEAYHQDPAVCSHVGFQAYENRYDFCQIDESAPIGKRIEDLRKMFLRLDPINASYAAHIRDLDPLTPEQLAILAE